LAEFHGVVFFWRMSITERPGRLLLAAAMIHQRRSMMERNAGYEAAFGGVFSSFLACLW
jgi:hypothetical protein